MVFEQWHWKKLKKNDDFQKEWWKNSSRALLSSTVICEKKSKASEMKMKNGGDKIHF